MTAVVGFITRGGIVVGTDSQMTDVSAGFKTVDAKKVFEIAFRGRSVILARAGSIEGSDMFHEEFENLATSIEINSERTVPNAAGTALLAARTKMQASLRGSLLTPKQKRQHIEDRGHSFLIAYAFNNELYLLEGNSNRPVPTKVFKPPAITGSGAYVALNALKGVDTEVLSFQDGIGWAAYAVEMAKESDPYCSGHTQIGCVAKDGNVEVLGSDLGKTIDSLTGMIIREMRERLGKKITAQFRGVPVALTDTEEMDQIERMLQRHLKRQQNKP